MLRADHLAVHRSNRSRRRHARDVDDEVDLTAVPEGQQIKVMWQGKPVFVRHRTAVEIAAAQRDDYATLKTPVQDADRLRAGKQRGQPSQFG